MTSTQLETDLRDTMREHTAHVPPDAIARLRAIDYHPRSHRLQPQLALGAVAGAAGAAGAAAAVVGLGTGAAPAFAGWTAKPTTASRAQVARAEAACRKRLAQMPKPPVPPGVPKLSGPSPAVLPVALVDTRGPFTFAIFAGSHESASCITGPGFVSLSGTRAARPFPLGSGQVMLSITHTSRRGHPYSFVEGHAGAHVTGAALQLSDGRSVRATISHGWFVAWWPASSDVRAVEITTPSGTHTEKFGALPTPPGSGAPTSASGSLSTGRGKTHGLVIQEQTTSRPKP